MRRTCSPSTWTAGSGRTEINGSRPPTRPPASPSGPAPARRASPSPTTSRVSRPANWRMWRTTADSRSRACRSSLTRPAWPSLTTSTRTGFSGTTYPVSSGRAGFKSQFRLKFKWNSNPGKKQKKIKTNNSNGKLYCTVTYSVPWPCFYGLTQKIPVPQFENI